MKYSDDRPLAVTDTECYVNYWSIGFRALGDGRRRIFEKFDDHPLDRMAVIRVLRNFRIVTFNGIKYDIPMIGFALAGATNAQLKQLSDDLIVGGLPHWKAPDYYGFKPLGQIDHIDLFEVAPGMASLKIYGGRLHSARMQDLPLSPSAVISPAQRNELAVYLGNDLGLTTDLHTELRDQLDLRARMSDQYDIDLRSKSDAQIAEAVIKAQLLSRGIDAQKQPVRSGTFRYQVPQFVRFQTEPMKDLLTRIRFTNFYVPPDGRVLLPKSISEEKIQIGNGVYRMGIGGLHSSESSVSYEADFDYAIVDRDVASYYPAIILNCKLAPAHLGAAFLEEYQRIVDRRLAAKRAGDKSTAETLKIVVNGSFGKLGSPYSTLYSPELMIQVTVTGQLSLLMLIEALECAGFRVVSANTDGVVTLVHHAKRKLFDSVLAEWERTTQFVTEETEYRALYARDVNNYIAVKLDGKTKTKGAYAPAGPGQPGAAGLKKNPTCEIAVDAAVAYLTRGVAIETTVNSCTDIRKFVAIRTVQGGAETEDGALVGKAIRWYYSAWVTGALRYRTNGNSVPRTEGAQPCMDLPAELPDDIDFDWYIREAYAILGDVGLRFVDPSLADRTGVMLARLPDQKNIHTVDLPRGIALCGAHPKTLRDRWVEYSQIPDGHRACSKCRKEAGL